MNELETSKISDKLTIQQSELLMNKMLTGKYNDEDIIEILTQLNQKNITADEMVGFLNSMKNYQLPFEQYPNAIDTCGTGGSEKNRFNISTCVALVLSSSGETVIKHGNYGSKRANGSFDFLDELDIPYQLKTDQIQKCIAIHNIAFLFARQFHPAMRHVASARKKMKKRTCFNILGPLANPAGVRYQLIGLPTKKDLNLMIEICKKKKMKKVLIVIGGDNRDEISLEGTSDIIEITNEKTQEYTFNFMTDIKTINPNYDCGDSSLNARLFKEILKNKDWNHPIIEHICVNASAGFIVLNKVKTLGEGYEYAKQLFEKEKVTKQILNLQTFS